MEIESPPPLSPINLNQEKKLETGLEHSTILTHTQSISSNDGMTLENSSGSLDNLNKEPQIHPIFNSVVPSSMTKDSPMLKESLVIKYTLRPRKTPPMQSAIAIKRKRDYPAPTPTEKCRNALKA